MVERLNGIEEVRGSNPLGSRDLGGNFAGTQLKLSDCGAGTIIAPFVSMQESVRSGTLAAFPVTSTLLNHRRERYRGDHLCLPLAAFAESDQVCTLGIYRFLESLFAVLQRQQGNKSPEALETAQAYVEQQDVGALLAQVRLLGGPSLQSDPSELLAKTIHDLRGGAMGALLGRLQLAQLEMPGPLGLRQLFFLTRDHLKIMRNALLGLDDAKRNADLETKMHSVDLIAEKWQHALVQDAERQTRLEVVCDFHGNIAECCIEFSALDRVLYNLVNNACRHTSSSEVQLRIHSQPEGEPEPVDLLFEVCNPVGFADRQTLESRGDLRALFQPGVSSTGSGFGLTVALDFVANAYGLAPRQAALEGNYLGAHLTEDNEFVVWFHWPVAADV